MSDNFSKCSCRHCGGHIEFPSTGIGRSVLCPHCNQRTLLSVTPESAFYAEKPAAPPASVPPAMPPPRRGIPPWVVALLVVIAANAGAYWYFVKRPATAAHRVEVQARTASVAPAVIKAAPPPDPWHGLMAGPIQLEKNGEGSLVYAVGTLTNTTDRERFGVKVELDVYDAQKNKLGTATDYATSILPGKSWKFKAMMTDRNAALVLLSAVKED